jgi:transcription initiation factor TFIIB
MELYDDVWKMYQQATDLRQNTFEQTTTEHDRVCERCGCDVTEDTINGILVCTSCGVIKEDYLIDTHSECTFTSNQGENDTKKDASRCGIPINPLLEKSSMSTMIFSSRKYHFMCRLHNQMSMDYVERSRYHVFENIAKMGGDIGNLSPVIINQAKCYYKSISERKLSRGLIRKGLIACCLMYACKALNVPRSIKEISQITNVPVTTLNKTSKLFMKLMGEELQTAQGLDTRFEYTDSTHLINRYCNLLHLSDKKIENRLIREVRLIDTHMKEQGILDCKTPTAIISGIILYAAGRLNIVVSKTEVSNIFQVSVVTINKIVKMIESHYAN